MNERSLQFNHFSFISFESILCPTLEKQKYDNKSMIEA